MTIGPPFQLRLLVLKKHSGDSVKSNLVVHKEVNICHIFKYMSSNWVKWLRMQGHRLPATLEVTGSNPGPGKINLIEKNTNGIPDSKKNPPLSEE